MSLEFLEQIELKIDGVTYPNRIARDLSIDRTNLEEEFLHQAERFAYYASMEALAKDRRGRLKAQLELLYAQLDSEKRQAANAMQAANPKFKYTEKMCENEVKGDTRYQSVMQEYHDADRLSNLLGAWRNAMDHRRESLISLGAHDRTGNFSTRVLAEQAKQTLTNKAQSQPEEQPKPTEATQPTTKTRRRPARAAQ